MKWVGAGLGALVACLLGVIIFTPGNTNQSGGGGLVGVPSEYEEVVLRAGRICPQITPALIAAQVEAESGWNPTAGSHAGAQGISQFMPGTWATHGTDGDGDGRADIYNPVDAIYSQGVFMCRLVDEATAHLHQGRVSGDVVSLALAAYNAGMGAVLTYGGIPPYRETVDYVEKILTNMKKFEAPPANSVGFIPPLYGELIVTSPFGARMHPVLGIMKFHDGVDFAAACGTPVYATASGVVTTMFDAGGGNMIRIDHGGGVESWYLHLEGFTIASGPVHAGQQIGTVGTTGRSTGCHLHFEIQKDGQLQDPMRYLQS